MKDLTERYDRLIKKANALNRELQVTKKAINKLLAEEHYVNPISIETRDCIISN